jgi:hypothetical protein
MVCFRLLLGLFLCLTWLLNGCAGKIKTAVAGSLIIDVAAATAKHDDLVLVAQGAPTYLLLLEGLLESNPNNKRLLLSTAEAYVSYGTLIEADDPQRAGRSYLRAKQYALKALAQNKNIAPLLSAPFREFSTIDTHLKDKDLALVFWAASSWGAWISVSTASMAALADLPKVIHLMEWVIGQDESFFYGSPHIFLGIYHGALPKMLGGSPEKSLHHFSRALEISDNKMIMVHVQMAKFYARQIFDRDLYESLLTQALALPVDGLPELTLQNVAAQKMARLLLEETDDFF